MTSIVVGGIAYMNTNNRISAMAMTDGTILLRQEKCPECGYKGMAEGYLEKDERCVSKFNFINACPYCNSIMKTYVDKLDTVIIQQ